MTTPAGNQLIRELNEFFDAVPRCDTDQVETGAFTLFVNRKPWSYYARPTLSHDNPITAADLVVLERVCADHGVPLTIEWVRETHPELADVATGHGLEVLTHSLMVADQSALVVPDVSDVDVRVIGTEDPALAGGRAVADVAFTVGGTEIGAGGQVERDACAARLSDDLMEYLRARERLGLTVTAVAESDAGVVAMGSYQRVAGVAEIVAVATLPAMRRRGLGGAIAAHLTRHAVDHGVRMILLSAQNDDVARVYHRVGFRRVGFTHAAERGSITDSGGRGAQAGAGS